MSNFRTLFPTDDEINSHPRQCFCVSMAIFEEIKIPFTLCPADTETCSDRLVYNSLLQFYKLPEECTNLHVCSLIYKTSKITVLNKIFPPINTTKEKQPVFSSRFLTPASFPWAINNSCLAQSLQCLQVPSNTTAFLGDLSLSLELCW